MYSTSVYIYQQKTRVLLIDTGGGYTFTYRYDPVYAKRLTINKGVDNVLLFEFINQDEKPVNITGSSFVFRLVSTNGIEVLLEKPMVIINAQYGRAKVTLDQSEILLIEAQPASYSISRHSGNLTEAVFTDAQAGARAPVDIVNSILPQFIPSSPLTIPTIELSSQATVAGTSFQNWPNWAGDSYWYGSGSYWNSWTNTEYFSSFIEPRGPLTTIQMDLLNYTGTIKAQAAENYQSLFYNVTESDTFYNYTGTIHWNVFGWYPLLRMGFNNSIFATPNPPGSPAIAYAFVEDGFLTNIVVQNPGSGYLAPPRVDIIGNGSGATAEAVINEFGVVTDIIVTNPGSGYWPIPVAGYNTAAYPVPPQNQGAYVVISTGFVVNLYYR